MSDDVAQPRIVLSHGGALRRAALAGMLRMSGYDVVTPEVEAGPDDRRAGAVPGFPAVGATSSAVGERPAGAARDVAGESAGDLCLILADDLNGSTGEVIREVRAAKPDLPVIVLSAREEPESILCALDAGARGYIGADADDDALLCAIEAAMSGSTVVNTGSEGSIAAGLRSLGYGPGACLRSRCGLSRREHEILGLLAANRTTSQIAAALCLAPKTVENYLTRIYSKLGVHSRAEAVAVGFHRVLSTRMPDGCPAELAGSTPARRGSHPPDVAGIPARRGSHLPSEVDRATPRPRPPGDTPTSRRGGAGGDPLRGW